MARFPVLVDVRATHVVWFDADDQDQAVRMAQTDRGHVDSCLGRATQADVDLTIYAPTEDWERALVKEPSTFGYPGEAAAAA